MGILCNLEWQTVYLEVVSIYLEPQTVNLARDIVNLEQQPFRFAQPLTDNSAYKRNDCMRSDVLIHLHYNYYKVANQSALIS